MNYKFITIYMISTKHKIMVIPVDCGANIMHIIYLILYCKGEVYDYSCYSE